VFPYNIFAYCSICRVDGKFARNKYKKNFVIKTRVENTHFFHGEGNENHKLGSGLFVRKRIISAVKKVEFVSDRMSYIILRGRWFHIIVLNFHAPTHDKTDDVKDSFYEELERVFDKFPK
jgi:hypothetical protein